MEIYKIAETEEGLSREEIRRALLQALEGRSVKRECPSILLFPFNR